MITGTVTSYCPSCSRVLGGFGFLRSALATGPRCCRHYASGHRHPRTAASPARPGLAGRRVEVAGLLDPGAASGLDLVVPRDVQPAGLAAAGGELTGADPVVDDMNAAAEPVGGFGDADLAVGSRRGGRGQRARARGAAQAGGAGDQFLAAGADLVVPGDAEPAALAAAGGQLAGVDPVVDDGGAAAQPAGGLGGADLAVVVGGRGGDVAGVADPLDGLDVERAAVPGGQPGGVQLRGQLGGGRDGAEPADHLHRRGRAAPGGAGVDGAGHAQLVGGAGVPADPDPDFGLVGFGQQGDVGDQGAQQPFAVFAAGGRGVPQAGQVGGEFFQVRPAGQRRQRFAGGLQRLPGLGEGGEPGFPAGFQAAGDQPVLRLAGAQGALGPVGVVAGAFDGELGGAADPLVPAGHLIGSGQRP